ncbi:MAG: hypothetical protein Kow0010_24370 [Dehalococcoidia bacterium]
MVRDVSAPAAHVNVSAHVVYLRPTGRDRLLVALARLGVFAHETPAGMPFCRVAPPRFSVVVTDRQGAGHHAVSAAPGPVIAIVPHASDEATFASAGMAVVNEDVSDDELLHALARVARDARATAECQTRARG